MRRLFTICLLLTALAGAAPATGLAGGSGPVFGVADDEGKYADDGGSNVYLLLADLGLASNRITVTWDPTDGNHGLTIRERGFLDRTVPIAALRGIDVVLDVYPLRAKVFAVDTNTRIDLFAQYLNLLARTYPTVTTFIVGNEPNQPRFHQPQFVRARSGYHATAGALYEHVLAAGYDALKAVNRKITVVGLGLSPRGNDDPKAKSNISRSPVRFLNELALEYRASGRDRPLMDALGFHPYPNSNDDPVSRGYSWPNAGIPNLDRIKQAVWDGFHGTTQPVFAEPPRFGLPEEAGPSLGLVLDEYGRQATIISSVASEYTGKENVRTVSEARQAAIYSWIVRHVECDPAVTGFYFFHLLDERDLDRFQSGLLRADWTKRPAYSAVKQALADTRGQCAGGIRIWRHTTSVIGADVTFQDDGLTVRANEDVTVSTGLVRASLTGQQILDALSGPRASRASGPRLVRAYHDQTLALSLEALAPGTYVQAAVLHAVMNPQRTFLAVGDPIAVGLPG
jgi:hypothetical protein